MKYNERFSKEEITHFDRKIHDLVVNNTDEWVLMVKRLRPTKTIKSGEKQPGLYRHYLVVAYLKEKFSFSEKTAFRFINYLVITPWFKVYSSQHDDEFSFDCSYMLISKILNDCREETGNCEQTTPNKYIDNHFDKKDKLKAIIRFGVVHDKIFLVDVKGNFWPIELAK